MSLTKEQIIEANKARPIEKVTIPEWGGDVYVHTLTVGQRLSLAEETQKKNGNATFFIQLVALTTHDDKGNKIWNGDASSINDLDGIATQRIFDAAAKLNGFAEEEVKELTGKSEPAQS